MGLVLYNPNEISIIQFLYCNNVMNLKTFRLLFARFHLRLLKVFISTFAHREFVCNAAPNSLPLSISLKIIDLGPIGNKPKVLSFLQI